MDIRKIQFNDDSNGEDLWAHLPQSKNRSVAHVLSRKSYLRVLNFLNTDVAASAYSELVEDRRYMRTDRMAKPTGIGLGILKSTDESLSPVVQKCYDLLTGADFRSWLAELIGQQLQTVKPPTLFRMELGDRIIRHDDVLHSPLNRVSVVLNLSKTWRREFGGNTVLGYVKRVEDVLSAQGEYQEHRWVFSPRRSVLVPAFNSLLVIALKQGMAHGVTTVRTNKAYRVSIVCLYGLKEDEGETAALF
jgi:hypothetical protein